MTHWKLILKKNEKHWEELLIKQMHLFKTANYNPPSQDGIHQWNKVNNLKWPRVQRWMILPFQRAGLLRPRWGALFALCWSSLPSMSLHPCRLNSSSAIVFTPSNFLFMQGLPNLSEWLCWEIHRLLCRLWRLRFWMPTYRRLTKRCSHTNLLAAL